MSSPTACGNAQAQIVRWLAAPEAVRLCAAGDLAQRLGVRLFVAGGTVRDLVLGNEHKDWDLVVEGDGARFAQALAWAWGGRAVIHERFLTARVDLPGDECLDVATARREVYPEPGALPVVEPAGMEQDLWRRDFAINAVAVALHPSERGLVLDPCGGLQDMDHGIVRALHAHSFWDDATRIVRAVGFEQRLGFAIETQTEWWIREAAAGGALHTVSTERLGEALLPLLRNSVGPQVLLRGHALGVAHALGARAAFTRRALDALRQVPEALHAFGEEAVAQHRAAACLTALLLGRGVEAQMVITRLHLDRATARELRGAQRALKEWPEGFRPAPGLGDLWDQLHGQGIGAVLALWLATDDPQVRDALVCYWTRLREVRPDITAADLQATGRELRRLWGPAFAAAIRAKLNSRADRPAQLAAALDEIARAQ